MKRLDTKSPALVLVSAASSIPLSYMMEAIVVPSDSWSPLDSSQSGAVVGEKHTEGARLNGAGRPRVAVSVSGNGITV